MFQSIRIRSAKIQSEDRIDVLLTPHEPSLSRQQFSIPGLEILEVLREGTRYRLRTTPIDPVTRYVLRIDSANSTEILADGILDRFFSDKPLGCSAGKDGSVFRVFAPQAAHVHLVLFERWQDHAGTSHAMRKDADGVWEAELPGNQAGKYYVYRLNDRHHTTKNPFSTLDIADPYSRSVIRLNHYTHPSKTYIPDCPPFDWGDDQWICPAPEDLVIYELHVRDMTVHPGSGVPARKRGTYAGLVHPGSRGGMDYIRALGVNAVELLPVHEFANLEVPYRDWRVPVWNTWNHYARNHWGYMTSFFFAPESYYAVGGHLRSGEVDGGNPKILIEFREMVRAFHREGIAVILDVVYNHASQYDLNPLRLIDREYYFRLDEDGKYQNKSFCGNDLYTERPMVRRLITDSLVFWMTEYHIDGFRFDLAGLIDDETLEAINRETRAVNPDVILIAEPWGGDRYGPERYARLGWGAWNDHFRNGVKGREPEHGKGFIFGHGSGADVSLDGLKRLFRGTRKQEGGVFAPPGYPVNYLESHDEWTLGDFVRIACGKAPDAIIRDIRHHVRLTPREERIHRLGALILLTSLGAVMIHAGQEFARSKVIATTDVPDPDAGRMDVNSYNKDNETNWIDYDHADLNSGLVAYYRGLIRLRQTFPQLRHADPDAVLFLSGTNPLALGIHVRADAAAGSADLLILVNGHDSDSSHLDLPEGTWSLLVSDSEAGIDPIREGITGGFENGPCSGAVLIRELSET